MAILLRHVAAVHLTGLPVRHAQQNDEPCETTRPDRLSGAHPQPIPFALPGGITGVPESSEPDTLACCRIAKQAAALHVLRRSEGS